MAGSFVFFPSMNLLLCFWFCNSICNLQLQAKNRASRGIKGGKTQLSFSSNLQHMWAHRAWTGTLKESSWALWVARQILWNRTSQYHRQNLWHPCSRQDNISWETWSTVLPGLANQRHHSTWLIWSSAILASRCLGSSTTRWYLSFRWW